MYWNVKFAIYGVVILKYSIFMRWAARDGNGGNGRTYIRWDPYVPVELAIVQHKSEMDLNISMICRRGAFFGDWVHWSSLYAESNLDFIHLCCAGVTDAQSYQMVQNSANIPKNHCFPKNSYLFWQYFLCQIFAIFWKTSCQNWQKIHFGFFYQLNTQT